MHCIFCGFYQDRFSDDVCAHYTDALIHEIEAEVDGVLYQSVPIHVVYSGGGTPSALSAHDLARIIAISREKLPLAPNYEIATEGQVLNLDVERVGACLDAGANHFSIGIQSFNSKVRKKMARTSDGPTVIAFMGSLVKRGCTAVVCDLLFGLPGQGAQTWGEGLAIARGVGLDGASLYTLSALLNIPLDKAVEGGRTTMSSPTERRDLCLQRHDFTGDVGWHCTSNSHWGRITCEYSLRNLLTKQGAGCLAFDSGAGGSIGGYSWMNERNLQTRHESVAAGRKLLVMIMRNVERNAQWRHTLQLGIETARVLLDELTPHAEKLALLLAQWHQKGSGHNASTCLWLTNEGRFWAGNTLQSLNELTQALDMPVIALEKP